MDIAEYFYWRMGSQISTDAPIMEGKKIFHELLKVEFDGLGMTTVSDIEWAQHITLVDKFKRIYTTPGYIIWNHHGWRSFSSF